MAGKGRTDFYKVLGVKKECVASELRDAYKKLALRWHPDRCSASGNLKFVEDSKKKFQAIQEAYSVLSDVNKRFMYDMGVYDSDDDDDEIGMGDFLSEMAAMMTQNQTNENGGVVTFEELQDLFHDMFSNSSSSSQPNNNSSKRNSHEMMTSPSWGCFASSTFQSSFSLGVDENQGRDRKRRTSRAAI